MSLISEDTGELTLEAQTINDLLVHLDFDPVWQLPGIQEFVIETKERELDEDGEPIGDEQTIHVLPGSLLARLIDEDDLGHSLVVYAYMLAEAIEEEGTSLEEKARVAALFDALGLDLEEAKKKNPFKPPYKKGTFKKLWKRGKAMGNRAVRSMIAMLHKGVIKRKGDGYVKDKGYKKGGTPAGKKKYELYKGKNKAKLKKAAKGALAASTEPLSLDAIMEAAVFGLAVPVDEALFAVAVCEDAEEVLAAFKESMGGKTGVEGYALALSEKAPETDTDDANKDETGDGEATEEGAFQPRSSLQEGAKLAGGILRNFESRGLTSSDDEQS